MKKLSLGLLASLSLWLGACFESPTASNSKGTDTPNALTITVDDSNNQTIPHTKVYALIKTPGQKDSLAILWTDSTGMATINYKAGSKIWISSTIDASKDVLYDIDSLTDSSRQMNLTLNHCLGPKSDSNTKLKTFVDLHYKSSRDLQLDTWDTLDIHQSLQNIAQSGAQGFYFNLIGALSPISETGPSFNAQALSRLRWIAQEAQSLGLELRLQVLDRSAAKAPALLQIMQTKTWIYLQQFNSITAPISSILCNELDCSKNMLEVSAFNLNLPGFEIDDEINSMAQWQVSNQYIRSGIDLQSVNSPIDLGAYDGLTKSSHFLILSTQSQLSPLNYPAEILSGGNTIHIRWEESRVPSATDKRRLLLNHYHTLIISDTLLF